MDASIIQEKKKKKKKRKAEAAAEDDADEASTEDKKKSKKKKQKGENSNADQADDGTPNAPTVSTEKPEGSPEEQAVPPRGATAARNAPPDYTKRLFITKTGDDITEDLLRTHYAALGENAITSIEWGMKDGKFRGFMFVHFQTEALCQQAAQLPAPEVNGRKTIVAANSVAPPPKLVTEMLERMKERRSNMEDWEEKVLKGQTLTPVTWTDERMAKFPVKKDFSAILRRTPRSDDEITGFRQEHDIQVGSALGAKGETG